MKYAQDWASKLSEEVTAEMRDEMKKKGHDALAVALEHGDTGNG